MLQNSSTSSDQLSFIHTWVSNLNSLVNLPWHSLRNLVAIAVTGGSPNRPEWKLVLKMRSLDCSRCTISSSSTMPQTQRPWRDAIGTLQVPKVIYPKYYKHCLFFSLNPSLYFLASTIDCSCCSLFWHKKATIDSLLTFM